jgi:hypothetical protein
MAFHPLRAARTALVACVVATALGCQGNDRPPRPRESGPDLPPPKALDVIETWEWRVETARLADPAPVPSEPVRGGLRVAVVRTGSLPAAAEAHQVAEDAPATVSVGLGRWPPGGWSSPALADPIWHDAEVRVEWRLLLRRRGTRNVDVELTPQVVHTSGRVATLSDLAIRRVVSLEESIVVGTDPKAPADHPKANTATQHVGAGGGGPGSLVVRVRE